jgi:predicted HicB family RNase H-like nuclease
MNEIGKKYVMIYLSNEDHAQLRIAAAYAGVSMVEFAKRATICKVKEQMGSGTQATDNERQ